MPPPAPARPLQVLRGGYVIVRPSPSEQAPTDTLSARGRTVCVRCPHSGALDCLSCGSGAEGPRNRRTLDGSICLESNAPRADRMVASLVKPLSAAGCPAFVTPTYLIIPPTQDDQARELLTASGHVLHRTY